MAGTGRGPSPHNFGLIPSANVQRSQFNRSHGLTTAFDFGYLIPIFWDEVLPGDTFTLRASTFGRLATPFRPVMDNMHLETFFFFVPLRLIWDNFQEFMGEDTGGQGSPVERLCPVVTTPSGGFPENGLSDYLGLPTHVEGIEPIAFWHRGYTLIWNEWFRDQNMQDHAGLPKDDGPDLDTDFALRRRGKRHDYLTSCLPWPQAGPAVTLPLGGNAPIIPDPSDPTPYFDTGQTNNTLRGTTADANASWTAQPSATQTVQWGVQTGLVADNSSVTGATINQLREAAAIQRLYERDARGGRRYTEQLRSHFGVTSPDQRLQRPEYLGGGSQNINVTPVAQTTQPIGVSDPLATLGAYGVTSSSGHGFTKSFVEHGIVLGLACARADLRYQQGLERMFTRRDKYDFYWPELAHLGEQAVLNSEIYAQGTAAPGIDDQVFGYQERWAEYRYKASRLTAEMRSNHTLSLDFWHLAQDFSSLPTLENSFIQENPPMGRVLAVPTERHLLFDAWFDYKCARPMPTFSVPGAGSRF